MDAHVNYNYATNGRPIIDYFKRRFEIYIQVTLSVPMDVPKLDASIA